MNNGKSSPTPMRRIPARWELIPVAIVVAGFAYTFIRVSMGAQAGGGSSPVAPISSFGLGFFDVYNFLLFGLGLYMILTVTQVMVSTDRFSSMKFSGFSQAKVRRLGFIYSGIIFAAKTGVVILFTYVQILSVHALLRGVEFRIQRRTIAPGILLLIAIFIAGLGFLFKEFTSADSPPPPGLEEDRGT